MKNYKYIVLILVALGNFLGCFSAYQTGSLSIQLTQGFNLTSGEFARLTTAQMIPTIFLSIFIGSIADKLGTKKTILIGLSLTVICLFLKMSVKSYILLFITYLGSGLIGAFLNPVNAKIVDAWFLKEELGVMMGIIQGSGALGQVVALALSGACTYQFIFKITFIYSLILFVLWIVLIRDNTSQTISDKINIIAGISNIETIYIGFILFALFGGFGTISSFLPSKLIASNLSSSLAGQITSITAIARFLGSLTFPSILRKLNNENKIITSLLVLFPVLLIMIAILNNQFLISIIIFILGYIVGGLTPILFKMPLNISSIKKENTGSACGLVSTLQVLGAVIVPSYICSGIAGSNYVLIYLVAAIISIFALMCYLLLQRKIKNN